MAIYGDMSEADRQISGNPDSWTRFRVVLANTSLGPGVSFDHPGHFTSVFFVAKVSQGITPADIAQLVGRVRYPIERKVTGLVLRKKLNIGLANYKSADILRTRHETISSYANSVATHLGPVRLEKRKREWEQIRDRALERMNALRRNPQRIDATQFQPTITTVPTYNSDTETLEGVPTQLCFGLTFAPTPVGKFCSLIGELSSYWSADSEGFLSSLEDIFVRGGAVCKHVGPRMQLDNDGNDTVLGSHYGFMNILGKQAESKDYEHLKNDFFITKWEGKVDQHLYDRVRDSMYDPKMQDCSSSLFRFSAIVKALEGAEDEHSAIINAMNRDVQTRFEAPIGNGPYANNHSIRTSHLPRKGDLAHQATTAELVESFLNVLTLFEHRFNPVTKQIETDLNNKEFCTRVFLESDDATKNNWWKVGQRLASLRVRSNPNFLHLPAYQVRRLIETEYAPEDAHKILMPILYLCMAWLGFPVLTRGIRPISDGVRLNVHMVQFDYHQMALSKALLGYSANGSMLGEEKAIADYKEYISNNPVLLEPPLHRQRKKRTTPQGR